MSANVHACEYVNVPAIYWSAPVGASPQSTFGEGGTGGLEDFNFLSSRHGYHRFQLINAVTIVSEAHYAPYAELMEEIKSGFGRTMSHLPPVFGVSRQTLYNWKAGELPREQHQAKLIQLAAAAQIFSEAKFKPTPAMLERTVAQGKSFIGLLSDGGDGREIALKLIRIVHRGLAAQEKLDAFLGDRKPPSLDVSDMGRPSLPEDV